MPKIRFYVKSFLLCIIMVGNKREKYNKYTDKLNSNNLTVNYVHCTIGSAQYLLLDFSFFLWMFLELQDLYNIIIQPSLLLLLILESDLEVLPVILSHYYFQQWRQIQKQADNLIHSLLVRMEISVDILLANQS